MTVQMIGTWKMCVDAFESVKGIYERNPDLALIRAIKYIEDNPEIHTVGRFSVPNEDGFLELDSAFMNGDNLHVGAVLSARSIINPIEVAYDLSKLRNNCILSSLGADKYAKQKGYKTSDALEVFEQQNQENHDTVGIIRNVDGHINVGISSSGRAHKSLGRVGDSPLVGSGFYCNSLYGGAVATGNGEDILRGCLAKEIVDALSFGIDIYNAVEMVGNRHLERILGEYGETFFMLIGMDKDGKYAVFTSGDLFPFATLEDNEVHLYFAQRENGHTVIYPANEELLSQYNGD